MTPQFGSFFSYSFTKLSKVLQFDQLQYSKYTLLHIHFFSSRWTLVYSMHGLATIYRIITKNNNIPLMLLLFPRNSCDFLWHSKCIPELCSILWIFFVQTFLILIHFLHIPTVLKIARIIHCWVDQINLLSIFIQFWRRNLTWTIFSFF